MISLTFQRKNKKQFNLLSDIFFSWQLKKSIQVKDTTSIILDKNKIVLRSA